MRGCGCGKRRSSSVVVRTKRYVWEVKGSFCRHEVAALLDAMGGVRDVVFERDRISFQAERDFDGEEFVRSLALLGIEVKKGDRGEKKGV
ncbi:MAG: hypothetical protein HPY78_00160 [Brevinematales bacterium]|jgi:hypothetical protein|nr:hypothetical protein [Brevinematales bacterium]